MTEEQAPSPATDTVRRGLLPDRPGGAASTGWVRASDAERESVVGLLHRALGEGRLDLHETEDRVAAAYAAVHREELPALLDDLPQQEGTAGADAEAPTWQTVWTALVWRIRASWWDAPGSADGRVPPGLRQQALAVAMIVLAGVWFVVCAVIGAVS